MSSDASAAEVCLLYRPETPGLHRLILQAASPLSEPDVSNNKAAVQIEAVDTRIRVLYVEDRSRFEYRYLKNLLSREPSIISSCLLLSADPDFPQEGTEPIRRFPVTFDELNRYDVVLLGDIDPYAGWAGPAGLDNLARWVEQKGGGVAWLAGLHNAVDVWRDTPLAKLLPVRMPQSSAAKPNTAQPFHPTLTRAGLRSPIFFLDPQGGGMPTDSLLQQLPAWRWSAYTGPPTPAAQALAINPEMPTPDGPTPVVVIGRYGAGQTFYCGTDDVWRWRRFRDIEHWRSFWLQAIRWLAGPRKLGAYRPVSLDASPKSTTTGLPVTFGLQIADSRLAADLPGRLSLAIRSVDNRTVQAIWLQRTAGQATYTGSCSFDRAGDYTAQADVAGAAPVIATFTVQLQQAETADVPADPAALHRWVQATKDAAGQGYTIDIDHLEQLAALPLPEAPKRVRRTEVHLWDNWLALLIVAGLFLTEWAWRRWRGLA